MEFQISSGEGTKTGSIMRACVISTQKTIKPTGTTNWAATPVSQEDDGSRPVHTGLRPAALPSASATPPSRPASPMLAILHHHLPSIRSPIQSAATP